MKIVIMTLAMAAGASSWAVEPLSRASTARPVTVDAGTQYNVELATRLIDGVVLQPREIFSFNRTLDAGRHLFRKGKSYYAGRIIMSRGGGYCQVSTTLYNAALLANQEIVERWQHSLYEPEVAYVPAGLDASVSNSSNADFRFRNTTPHPLTIAAKFEDGAVKIELLGQGRRRKRWLTTSRPGVISQTTRVRWVDDLPAGVERQTRQGFDGYIVKRYLNYLDRQGNTHTVYIGKDQYQMVPRRVDKGRQGSPLGASVPAVRGTDPGGAEKSDKIVD